MLCVGVCLMCALVRRGKVVIEKKLRSVAGARDQEVRTDG